LAQCRDILLHFRLPGTPSVKLSLLILRMDSLEPESLLAHVIHRNYVRAWTVIDIAATDLIAGVVADETCERCSPQRHVQRLRLCVSEMSRNSMYHLRFQSKPVPTRPTCTKLTDTSEACWRYILFSLQLKPLLASMTHAMTMRGQTPSWHTINRLWNIQSCIHYFSEMPTNQQRGL